MTLRKHLCALLLTLLLTGQAFAGEISPISLKPFIGDSPFEALQADWLLPRGHHVFDGVPWEIDGTVLLYADYYMQRSKPAPVKIDNILVGKKFDTLHLLAAAQSLRLDSATIAKIHLQYSDGTTSSLDIVYGDNVSGFQGPWHHSEEPLNNQSVHEAWHTQCDSCAYSGSYLRLFHIPLANPNPAKEVRALSLESTRESTALFVAAISVGPADAAPLPSESIGKAPFPDTRPRSGQRANGEGYVYDSAGKPVANAIVKVVLARKYTDYEPSETAVGVQAITDATGHFTLTGLPDDCAYRLLISAENFTSSIYHGLDPISDPITVRLKPANAAPAKYAARARIIDPDGKPIAFAQVDREGIGYERGTSWGGPADMPETTVTDKNGEIVLSQNQPFNRVQIKVNVPSLAPLHEWIPVTNGTTILQMVIGSTIHGRVLDLNNKPLPNVELAISGADRNSELYAGHYSTTTRPDGTFAFEHVAPRVTWNLYGVIGSFKKFGALPPRSVISGFNGETNEVGDLQIIKGVRLAGQVKTRLGEPLPKELKISLSYEKAWDSQTANVDREGRFSFDGLYPEKIGLYILNNDWKLAGLNRSLSFYSAWRMEGILEKDKDDLLLLIEKGKRESSYSSSSGSLPPEDSPAAKPIAGAEHIESEAIILAGTVIDDETGKPIAKCKIVPGYKPVRPSWAGSVRQPKQNLMQKLLKPLATKQVNYWELPVWLTARTDDTTNGTFSVAFIQLKSTPMLRIEAAGYAPFVTEPIPTSTNGMVIRLSRGSGPSGVVLLPDGNPAENATIHYAGQREQFGLEGRDFNLYGESKKQSVKTAADGAFKFPLLAEDGRIYVAHPTGYAEQPVTGKNEKLKIQLKPWATLQGALTYSNGTPATNVELGLQLYDGASWDPSKPLLHYSANVKTDAKGNFLFTNVPPRHVQVCRIIPSGPHSWTSREQTWLDVEPGTNDLGNVTYDTPPPPPLVDQLKKKLGL